MRKFLVTGGSGFVGSHLCEALIERGDEVFVMDDLSTGRLENIAHLQEHPRFHLVISSILDLKRLEPLVRWADAIFHLAAVVGVKKIIDAPVETIETNILGSHNVLALAAQSRKLCLITSTSEVYGKSVRHPYSENDDVVYGPTVKSRWSYACSKAIDEFLALAYWESQKLPIIVARLFNTTGPRQTGRYGMVLPRFVDQAMRGDAMTVYGTGTQTRCFADVRDVVRALLMLMQSHKAVGQVFNVGNPQEISISELARLVKKMTHSRSEICVIPYEQAYQPGFEDMERRVPNIEKITRMVGFKPHYRLHDTISRMIHSWKEETTAAEIKLPAVLQPNPLPAEAGE
jgi:UDP-glucose 4-epimerase